MTWNLASGDLPGWVLALVVIAGLFVEIWSDNDTVGRIDPMYCQHVCYPGTVERASVVECVCRAEDP